MKSTAHVTSFATKLFLQAAEELKYQKRVISSEHSLIEIRDPKFDTVIKIVGQTIDANDMVGAEIANDKHLTSTVLKSLGSLIPGSEIIEISTTKISNTNHPEFKELKKIFLKFKKRIVVKPLNLSGGEGISILPKTEEELISSLNTLKDLGVNKALIETFIKAKKEYRLLCYKGEVIDVVQRLPANVVGDGKHTITQLMDHKMKRREKYGLKAFTNYDKFQNQLEKKNLTLDSIPKKNQQIWLMDKCNWSLGGDVIHIPLQEVHQDHIKLMKKIYELTQVNYTGVDLMTEDIKQGILNTTCINEINSKPGFFINYYADLINGNTLRIPKKILETIMNDKQKSREN